MESREITLYGFSKAIDFARIYTIIEKYKLSNKYGKKDRRNALYFEFENQDGECDRYGIYLRQKNYMIFKEV
jgi:hypothetical protein